LKDPKVFFELVTPVSKDVEHQLPLTLVRSAHRRTFVNPVASHAASAAFAIIKQSQSSGSSVGGMIDLNNMNMKVTKAD